MRLLRLVLIALVTLGGYMAFIAIWIAGARWSAVQLGLACLDWSVFIVLALSGIWRLGRR